MPNNWERKPQDKTFFKDTEKYLDYILVGLIIMKGAKDQQEDWFRESVIGDKRQVIKNLIETLATQNSLYQ